MTRKKREKKIYNFGSVLTIRLSPDSGVDQEVLDWINNIKRNRNKEIIDAIKCKIALEKKLVDNLILNKLVVETNSDNNSKEEMAVNKYEKAIIKPVSFKNIRNLEVEHSNSDEAEDELFGATKEKSLPPGLRALRGLKK